MRIGLNIVPPHETPEQWAQILADRGYRASVFPVNYRAKDALIQRYVEAARERDILIAEVGIWNSPHHPDEEMAREARRDCLEQFRLAEYVRARCCVNVSGAAGEVWYACYRDNYGEELYRRNVEFVQELCDTVKPQFTSYSLEPMQWMLPRSVEEYADFLRDVRREHCKVHMDIFNLVSDPYLYTHQEELMEKAFRTLGPDIVSCHIKDIRMEQGTTVVIRETPLGTGEGNWREYLRQISRLEPDMPVLIEHLPDLAACDEAFAQIREALAGQE